MNTIPIIFLMHDDYENTTTNTSSNNDYNSDENDDYDEDYDENIRPKGENDMRILTKMDEDGTNEIISIIDANYDDNIYDAKDKNKKVEGFLFMTADEEMYAIPEMSQAACNSICQELLIRGYADLTTYKPYEEI